MRWAHTESGGMDSASATETVDSGSIFSSDRTSLVGRWQLDSKTKRSLAVTCPRQLGE